MGVTPGDFVDNCMDAGFLNTSNIVCFCSLVPIFDANIIYALRMVAAPGSMSSSQNLAALPK